MCLSLLHRPLDLLQRVRGNVVQDLLCTSSQFAKTQHLENLMLLADAQDVAGGAVVQGHFTWSEGGAFSGREARALPPACHTAGPPLPAAPRGRARSSRRQRRSRHPEPMLLKGAVGSVLVLRLKRLSRIDTHVVRHGDAQRQPEGTGPSQE